MPENDTGASNGTEKPDQRRKTRLARLADKVNIYEIVRLFSFTGILYGPLDERLELKDAVEKALRKTVPNHVNWSFCLGGLTLLFYMIQVATGVLLAFYYKPSVEQAYASVQFISNHITFGWLVRQIHAWSANLMILSLFAHMLRVFLYGAYKPPRDLNWLAGSMLLFLAMTFGFTGYLLPWDQLSYWATTVGSGLSDKVPVVGRYMMIFMRGGEDVTGATLARFYTIHVVVLPWVAAFLLVAHFLMIRKQGISEPM